MHCLLKFVYKMLTEKGLNKLISIVDADVRLFIKNNKKFSFVKQVIRIIVFKILLYITIFK